MCVMKAPFLLFNFFLFSRWWYTNNYYSKVLNRCASAYLPLLFSISCPFIGVHVCGGGGRFTVHKTYSAHSLYNKCERFLHITLIFSFTILCIILYSVININGVKFIRQVLDSHNLHKLTQKNDGGEKRNKIQYFSITTVL